MPQLAVAVLGPDQPGVVAALAEALLAENGNLEDVSMTLLRGQFAMTLVVDTPVAAAQAEADLRPVAERLGLLVSVRAAADQLAVSGAATSPFVVSVHGADRPGIVAAVTAAIARHRGNITDLSTRLAGHLYVLVAEVDVPDPVEPLADELRRVGEELGVDVHVRPADVDVL